MNPTRVLRGRPVIDVNDVLTLISPESTRRHERVHSSPIALHCVATDVDSAQAVDLHGHGDGRELWDAVLASSRMPWAGGPPVEIDGRRYVDGGIAAPIPVAEAVAAGATHVLALQTRPHGIPRKSASRIGDRLIERHLRTLNPALVTAYRDRVPSYERLVVDIARWSREGGGPPYVLGIRPGPGRRCVSQLERRGPVLSVAAADAERLVEAALRLGAARLIRPRGRGPRRAPTRSCGGRSRRPACSAARARAPRASRRSGARAASCDHLTAERRLLAADAEGALDAAPATVASERGQHAHVVADAGELGDELQRVRAESVAPLRT